jgi:hypothetical protein
MTVNFDITQTWSNAIVDIGPIELRDDYWGIVGSIPYDGHVVLAVVAAPTPTTRATSPSLTKPSTGSDHRSRPRPALG